LATILKYGLIAYSASQNAFLFHQHMRYLKGESKFFLPSESFTTDD